MANSYLHATKRAIEQLVRDFQSNRFGNERDIHWKLFHYLKQEGLAEKPYESDLIRAEFPTLGSFGGQHPARGKYDLVILNPASLAQPAVRDARWQESWDKWLPKVNPLVAVEIKLWWNKLDAEKANRDVEKLTAVGNKVENAFFLNFVRLGLLEQHSKDNFQSSRAYLVGKKKQWPHLNVLCVPDKAGHQARHLNWL